MSRPIAFDATHVVSRLVVERPSGIDKVDLLYLEHFARDRCSTAVHYGLTAPRFHDAKTLPQLSALATADRWSGGELANDQVFAKVLSAVAGIGAAHVPANEKRADRQVANRWRRRATQIAWRLSRGRSTLPEGAIYLNVAQHVFESHRFFRWLDHRSDVVPVFMVHDLLPLDYPEFFRPGYKARFERRFATISRYARALIVASASVADRVRHEYRKRGLTPVPIWVAPLPSPLNANRKEQQFDAELVRQPYFIMVGTIEPRKNHLLVLNSWRRMVEDNAQPPKLVIVGGRGWENEQVLDVLDRSVLVRPHVIEVAGITDVGLATLLRNARAALVPSFAEGYGLPVVEALSLGTPVLASNIAVFKEVGQDRCQYLHPLYGPGWRQAILDLCNENHPRAVQARAAAQSFRAPNWTSYFEGVDEFLRTL
ncbi:glycosyltransferase family 4 protein [Hyphomicrobium sp. 2TAF46]|uniref:glycosyltransferase family 4 protein n=1 Tax=Hyphomicrobium sp. 2TAF46 TaxID=3233019 RepID=UPI003F8FD9B5